MATVLSALCGEIDVATVDAFQIELYLAISGSGAPIVYVDLAAVTFMDSTGYHALVAANWFATWSDHILVIRNLPEQCVTLLRLCDLRNELLLENDPPIPN